MKKNERDRKSADVNYMFYMFNGQKINKQKKSIFAYIRLICVDPKWRRLLKMSLAK